MGKVRGDFCRFGLLRHSVCENLLSTKPASCLGNGQHTLSLLRSLGNAGRSRHAAHRHSFPSAQSHLGEGAQECVYTQEHRGDLARTHTQVYKHIHRCIHSSATSSGHATQVHTHRHTGYKQAVTQAHTGVHTHMHT